jgi:hypothetical protein
MFTRLFLSALLLLLNLSIGLSQIDSLKFKTELNLGGNISLGNFTTYNLIFRSENELRWNNIEINLNPKFQYSQISTAGILRLREREVYTTLSFTKRNNNWRFLFFGELEHTFLRKIDLRTSFGFGIGKKLIKTKNLELDISEVLLPEITISDFNNNRLDNFALRPSTRIKFVWEKTPLKFTSINLFQPSIYTVKNGGNIIPFVDNINARSLNNFEVSIAKHISLGVGTEVIIQTYPSSLNPTVMPVDWIISLFIKYKI